MAKKTLTISFKKTYKGQDMCELLHGKLVKSGMESKFWESLTRKIPNM